MVGEVFSMLSKKATTKSYKSFDCIKRYRKINVKSLGGDSLFDFSFFTYLTIFYNEHLITLVIRNKRSYPTLSPGSSFVTCWFLSTSQPHCSSFLPNLWLLQIFPAAYPQNFFSSALAARKCVLSPIFARITPRNPLGLRCNFTDFLPSPSVFPASPICS